MQPDISHEEIVAKAHHFVIVGGGTAGLVLAARLSENPAVNVLVLEAGENRLGVGTSDLLPQHRLTNEVRGRILRSISPRL